MHYYFFDHRSSLKPDNNKIAQISSWIKTSRVAGEQFQLHSPQQLLEQTKKSIHSGHRATITVIGDDLSLDMVISALQSQEKPTTLAYIPLTTHSRASELLGFTTWKQAANALMQAKRESFDVVVIEDYTTLASATLIPKPSSARHAQNNADNLQLKLDHQLELYLPQAELIISNLSQEPHMQDQTNSFLIEARRDRHASRQLSNTTPLIKLTELIETNPTEILLRLKACTMQVTTIQPLLFQGLIQLRSNFEIAYSSKQQDIIVHRKRDSLT